MRKSLYWDRLVWIVGLFVIFLGMLPSSRCSTLNLEIVPIQSISIANFDTTLTFVEDPFLEKQQSGDLFYVLALFGGQTSYKGVMIFTIGENNSMIAYAIGDPVLDVLSWSMGAPITHFQWLDPLSLKLIFLEISPYIQQEPLLISALAFTASSPLGAVEESCYSIIQFYGNEFTNSSTSSSSSTTSTESGTSTSPFTISGYSFEILIPILFVGVSAIFIHRRRKR